ncbi:hypothetical protein KAR91_21775 [Candidatus Pacearchaeota archaeon]|nr:hypothetical protein [Candidatus Pacearchaeota archaeon]
MPETDKDQEEDKETCLYCSHIRVCGLFIGVQPLFMKWEKDPPIDPRNLYKICGARDTVLVQVPTNGIKIEGIAQ